LGLSIVVLVHLPVMMVTRISNVVGRVREGNMFNKLREKTSSFVAMHPKVMMYGISLGVTLGLTIGLSYVFAPHEAFAACIRRGSWARPYLF
jgi:hypothetical protein